MSQEHNCKKVIRDRLNELKSKRSQYTQEKMSKRISEDIVRDYDIRIIELKKILSKLE